MPSSLEQGIIPALTARDAGYVNGNQGRSTHHDEGGKTNKKNEYTD